MIDFYRIDSNSFPNCSFILDVSNNCSCILLLSSLNSFKFWDNSVIVLFRLANSVSASSFYDKIVAILLNFILFSKANLSFSSTYIRFVSSSNYCALRWSCNLAYKRAALSLYETTTIFHLSSVEAFLLLNIFKVPSNYSSTYCNRVISFSIYPNISLICSGPSSCSEFSSGVSSSETNKLW